MQLNSDVVSGKYAANSNLKEKYHLSQTLIDFGHAHFNDKISIDYFAVSLPDLLVFDADFNLRNKVHCFYLMALGNLGLGNGYAVKAEKFFDQVLELDKNHQGALIHKGMMKYMALVKK